MRDEIRRVEWGDPILAPYVTPDMRFSTEIWAGFWDGQFAIAWGLVPPSLLSDRVYIWTVAEPQVLQHCRKTFLRRSREVVAEIQRTYPILAGLCDRRTVWLEHLGARFNGTALGLHKFEIGG